MLCLGTFAVLLDTAIVNALPSLVTGLYASLDQASTGGASGRPAANRAKERGNG
jgi:hypothetical protein